MTTRDYLDDPRTYPPRMTYTDLDRILRKVFIELEAPRCVEDRARSMGSPKCLYHPPAGSKAVGCVFAVLVPPYLRSELQERRSAVGNVRFNTSLSAYFQEIEDRHLGRLQAAHDFAHDGPPLRRRLDEVLRKIMEEVTP